MQYKLLDYYVDNDIQDFNLNHILKARGLDEDKINLLMNLDDSVILNPFDMMNMTEGINLLMRHIDKRSTIAILIDEDCDGETSASLMYLYLQENFSEYITLKYIINKNKMHGVDLKYFEEYDPEYEYDLLIIPDASAGQDEVDFLNSKDVDVLILDHHHTEKPAKGAVTVNPNQSGCKYQNKDLSGVGVVYKFLKALSDMFNTSNPDDYLDLVAIGMVGDVMSMKSPETRHLINKGLQIMQERRDKIAESEGEKFPEKGNKLINAFLQKKYDYDLKKLTHKTVAFKIVPFINGCIRSGTQEEKDKMFKAFLGSEEDSTYQPRRKAGAGKDSPKPDPITLPLYLDAVRILTSVKSRQDREIKKALNALETRIAEKDLLRGKLLMINATDIVSNKSLTGLMANKLAEKYKRPTIILKQRDENRFGGSGRNFDMSPIESLNEFIWSTGLAKAYGHPNAHGFDCYYDNILPFWEKANEMLKDVELSQVHKVDAIIPYRKLTTKKVLEIGKLIHLWGADLSSPKIVVTGVSIPVKDITRIGDKGTIIKFKKDKLSFYKFGASEEEANQMRMREKKGFGSKNPKYVVFDMIVEFEINEFNGNEYPQIVIQEYTVRPKEEVLF